MIGEYQINELLFNNRLV